MFSTITIIWLFTGTMTLDACSALNCVVICMKRGTYVEQVII